MKAQARPASVQPPLLPFHRVVCADDPHHAITALYSDGVSVLCAPCMRRRWGFRGSPESAGLAVEDLR